MKTVSVDRLLPYLVSQFPDAIISDFNYLTSGFESEIYTFRLQHPNNPPKNFILRLFNGEGATEKLIRESKGLSWLAQAGFPVPQLFLQEPDSTLLGKPFEIIARIEGQALWPVLAMAEPNQVTSLLSRFGVLLATLHKLDWHSFMADSERGESDPTQLLDGILSHYRTLYTTYHLTGFLEIVAWLDAHKHEIAVHPAIVHQDFHANNVLISSKGEFFVIDWTQFDVSDYRIDLCWTLLIMGDLGNPAWEKQILDAYAAECDTPIEHLDYFSCIVTMKLLASMVIGFNYGPEGVGLRAAAFKFTEEQWATYRRLSQRLQMITGSSVPELNEMLQIQKSSHV